MIFDAEEFSTFEFCPKKPQLMRVYEPPQWPVRDAVKRFFQMGVRGIMAGESPELAVSAFIAAAAKPGFTYPEGDHYTLAQDHAAWLDGALRIIREENSQLEPLPLFQVGDFQVHVNGFQGAKIFRVQSNFDQDIRWPELVAMAFGMEVEVTVFRLPSVRNGRVLSPLSMAYQHPSFKNIQYRIARLFDEPEFNKNWHKIGRWEITPAVPWEEWRLGIDRDKCIDQIRQSHTISPTLDAFEQKRLLYDIEMMCVSQERPSIFPRYRETCHTCVMSGLCHGNEDSRNQYTIADRTELERYQKRMLDKGLSV